ncbi:MAG: hypothetical protein H6729_00135 [Deltaproteobacteria bacterium]|nr:hypothetical protein [Deltaproteobacteria bacterium]
MTTIEPGTTKYDRLFGPIANLKFESRQPTHDVLVAALSDPSVDPNKIDEAFAINDKIGSSGILRRQGVEDLQFGSKFMVRSLAVPVTGGEATLGNGMPSHLIHALDDVCAPVQLASSLSTDGVNQALGVITSADPGAAAARAAFGLGMTVLSSMGPIGAAAAAIVGFAAAIFSAFRSKKVKEAKSEEARRQAAYEALPPLQEERHQVEVDDWYINAVLLNILESGSWTPIFSPRFDPNAEWVGVSRFGGYALAPGKTLSDTDDFGNRTNVFSPTGGVGFIPGLNRITSVVQVSLDWQSNAFKAWHETLSGKWPITQALVRDVGSFYTNTSRLAAVAWSWVSQQDGGLDLYKVNVGRHNGPGTDHLHYKWKAYCESGLRFLTDNADDWVKILGEPPNIRLSTKRLRSDNPQYVFGSAIGCAVGAWRCIVKGGTTYHPVYSHLTSGGYETFEMGEKPGLGPGRLRDLGCVMDVPSTRAMSEDGKSCLITMYDTDIRPTLEQLRKRQFHYLRHSLVSAYVRRSWDAFKDDELHTRLLETRMRLLEHPDRKLINLRDVPRDEPGVPGKPGSWREQLLAAGVPKIPTLSRIKSGQQRPAGTIEPGEDPPPTVPGANHAMPFGGFVQEPDDGASNTSPQGGALRWKQIAGVGATLAVGAGSVLALSRYRR